MHHTSENPRRPSVLHIFKIYYPDLFGGTLTVIRDICASLKDSFASAVLVCSQSAERREIVVNDVPVERVRSFGNVLSLPAAPTYPWRLWRKIAEHDLLALHAPFPLADLVFAFGFGANRPLVVHWHADIVTHAGLRWFIEPLMRRTLRRAKAIIVSDHALIENTPLLREFVDKCHVVPFGIDTSGYDWPKIEPHHVNDRGRLVLACGRLVPYKGFDVLIRAAVNRKFEVWIIGEGTERPRLEQLIRELGLGDRVRLLGSVNDSERIKLMCLSDVFVMPSVTNAETFGLVQLEAMAAGRPVVNTALDTAVPRVARHGMEAIPSAAAAWDCQPGRAPSPAIPPQPSGKACRPSTARPSPRRARNPQPPPSRRRRPAGWTPSGLRPHWPGRTCATAMCVRCSARSGCRFRWRSWSPYWAR
ncbi:glycosyltransferase [Bradyrhizobium sp. S3.9.1]|uniref:glycosyltransferase n=1 Tax=Bradyrhizobium sp. S3.9.1 TaxID=3156431 RepID=UPI0033960E64